jgi:hypothetical protein
MPGVGACCFSAEPGADGGEESAPLFLQVIMFHKVSGSEATDRPMILRPVN